MAESESSFGSGVDSEASSRLAPPGEGEETGLEETGNSLEGGLFGVLYTVSKEKAPSWWFVAFRLFMDWIQVFLLIVNPQYGWDIDPNNKLWQAFNFIQLNYFMSTRGYTFFLICLYIMAVALAANLALCIWVSNSFKNNKFDHVWPIVWLRYFSLVFYQVLDIASLTLFLMTMDCQYFSVDASVQGYNQEFPDVYCWSMPHIIHVAVAAVSIATFFVLASVFTMAEIELNPVSKNLMGIAHTRVEVIGFAIKMFMTCVTVFVNGTRWASCFQFIACFFLCYLYLKWLPHLTAMVNHIRIGTYFSVFWASLWFIIMAFEPGIDPNDDAAILEQQKAFTIVMWVGFVPCGLFGAWLSIRRTAYFTEQVAHKYRDAPEDMKPRRIYKFTDAREVEITSRCCRVWLDEDSLDPDAVTLAERVIRAGMQLLPNQPYMAIWWSSFLIDVQGSYQSGYSELQNAKKLHNPSFLERFCIFIREQEHTQKASAASSGDNANVDLVSYVEFQRNYRLAMRLHVDALIARRTFWETLLHNQVSFAKLSTAVQRIETTVRASERMYKQVLQRHSNSVKILTLYVKFLQNVRNDPWSAARWSAEAEKLQRLEEEANERAVFGDGKSGMQSHDDSKGVIIMGANCLVRMINERAATMLGYAVKNELVGKNINLIVPPPFARNHNNYVRNYIQTGQAKILDQRREFVALHKDRYVFPIELFATKVSGIGEDSVFMGIFQQIPPQPKTATLWVLNGGSVLSCDGDFTDWLGYKHEDIYGRPVSELMQDKQHGVDELLNRIHAEMQAAANKRPINPDQRADASFTSASKAWTARGMRFKHLYIDEVVECDVSVRVAGIGDTAVYAIKMTRQEISIHKLLVTDAKGRIRHVTSRLASQLGTTVSKLQAGNMLHALDVLLPAPFMRVHHTWYREKSEVAPVWSCRSGLIQCVNAMGPEGPCVLPYALQFKRKEVPSKEPLNVVQFEERTMEQMLDERRLTLTLNSQGVITNIGPSPLSLFNFDPQALVGTHLSYILDVLSPLNSSSKRNSTGTTSDEEAATKVLMHMAERSYDMPGMSWRVGVTAIMDPAALRALGPMGMAMIAKRTVPAVMVVDAFMAPPQMDGARVVLPSEMQLKVELWRADYLSGVIELDTTGHVVTQGIHDQHVFMPNLLTGVPAGMLAGAHLGALIPLNGKPLLEALFTEGGLTPPKPGGRGPGHGGRGGARGGLRNAGQYSRRRGVGPLQTIKLPHGTDGAELELSVQAVVKQDIGVGSSLYILLHPVQPRPGRLDLRTWIWSAPPPTMAGQNALSRRASRRSNLQSEPSTGKLPKELVYQYNMEMDAPPAQKARARFTSEDGKPHEQDKRRRSPERPKDGDGQDAEQQLSKDLDKFHSAFDDLPATPRDADGTDGTQAIIRDHTSELERSNTSPMSPKAAEPPGMVPTDAVAAEAAVSTEGKPALDLVKVEHEVDYESPLRPRPPSVSPRKDARTSAAARALKAGASTKRGGKRPISAAAAKARKAKGENQGSDSESGSVGSTKAVLKEGGRERITRWMTQSEAPSSNEAGDSDDEIDEDEAQDVQEEEEMDDERYAEELDEAGKTMNDYKRGKRLKKLAKMLMGPQAQAPNVRLKWVSIGVVLLLIVVDLTMFMTFMQLVNKQKAQVFDLRSSSRAVNRVMQVSVDTSALEILLAGENPELRHLGEEGVQTSLDYIAANMKLRLDQMDTYHQGIYRGFGTTRELPEAYNLRTIWQEPILPMLQFYETPAGAMSKNVNLSLWDAGNLFIKSARNILQNFENDYGFQTNNSLKFENSTDVLFILYNGPRELINGYQQTLDGMMQQAIDDSANVNNVQLIILAVEGGFIGVLAVIVIWVTSSKLVFRRFNIYCCFMVVPAGIIKTLATKSIDLEQGDEVEGQENDGDDQDGVDVGNTSMGAGNGSGMLGSGGPNGDVEQGGTATGRRGPSGSGVKINLANQQQQKADGETTPKGFWASLFTCFRPAEPANTSKRQLKTSWTSMLWITWPFICWAVFVIVINSFGYSDLKNISAPIAISNIVQFVSIRVNRVLLFSQRLCSEQYLDPNLGYTSASPDAGPVVAASLKAAYRHTLTSDYALLRQEVDAMLYGSSAASVANNTSPHFKLATTGIMFTQGADIMYSDTSCFCQEPDDCQPEGSDFYAYTRNGLDQALKQFFYSIESLIQAPDNDTNMHNPFFVYIFEIGNTDITGGLVLLTDVYTNFVTAMYQQALQLHIVAFCVCCALGAAFLLFIMRPNYTHVAQESKRVAELLSNIPPEIDIEALVAEAIRVKDGQEVDTVKATAEVPGKAGKAGVSKHGKVDMLGDDIMAPSSHMAHRRSMDDQGVRRSVDMGGHEHAVRRSMDMNGHEYASTKVPAYFPA